MATFANSMKSEIARVARKETKADIVALRQAVAANRSEIADLKKQLKFLASTLNRFSKSATSKTILNTLENASSDEIPLRKSRTPFGPARLIEFRRQLGITQAQMAKLLDASTLSVLKWEAGKVVPREKQLQKIAEVLKLGKREALQRIAN